jgi:predicted LPLAT superfamily acyltransferase
MQQATSRPAERKAAPEWRNRPERSNVFAIRLIVWVALRLGRRVARALLYPVCTYFLLFSPRMRAASRKYLGKVLDHEPGLADVFRHCYTFAATVLDRVFLLGNRFEMLDVRLHGLEAVQETVARNQGCILLGAHLGSFEIIRALSREKFGPPACMVMYEENARKLNSVLYAINPELAQQVIELGRPDSMLKVREALQRGEFAGILADRVIEGEGSASHEFLGEQAKFPTGPLRMACMLKAPILLMVGLYRGGNRYEVYFENLGDMATVDAAQRDGAIDRAMRAYVRSIEHYCRMAPYNWFNFFDFWR